MTELGDFKDQTPASGGSTWKPGGKPPWAMIGIGMAVAFIVAFAAFLLLDGGEPEPPPQAVVEEAPPPPPPPPPPIPDEPEPFELPTLGDSDTVVRALIEALSAHPGLASWLVTDDLIRTFVVTVDNVAYGRNPSQHLLALRPDSRIGTEGQGPALTFDPVSFRRYESHAEIVASLDTAGTAELFLQLRPLMDEAYAELGYPNTPFMDTFERAVAQLLEAPVVEGQPSLVRRASFFEYTDPALEALPPVQKQLMGMGPDNMRVVQDKVRAIALATGVSAERLPSGSVLLR